MDASLAGAAEAAGEAVFSAKSLGATDGPRSLGFAVAMAASVLDVDVVVACVVVVVGGGGSVRAVVQAASSPAVPIMMMTRPMPPPLVRQVQGGCQA